MFHSVIVAFYYVNVLECVLCLQIPQGSNSKELFDHPTSKRLVIHFPVQDFTLLQFMHLSIPITYTYVVRAPSLPTGAELPQRKVNVAFKGENEEQLDVNEGDYVVVIKEDSSGEWGWSLLLSWLPSRMHCGYILCVT